MTETWAIIIGLVVVFLYVAVLVNYVEDRGVLLLLVIMLAPTGLIASGLKERFSNWVSNEDPPPTMEVEIPSTGHAIITLEDGSRWRLDLISPEAQA